jgi:succinate-semialdehyde dehydrogenase / glutarate-semialdehyde dehydrogenase
MSVETAARDAQLLIGGAWSDGAGGRLPLVDPATEATIGHVALAGPRDLDAAVAAAQRAFEPWAATPPHERGAVLLRAAALLRERTPAIAADLCAEAGKLEAEAAAELARAADTLQFNGEEAARIEGRVIAGRAAGGVRVSAPVPLGVVAAFAAWNFPAVLATRKLGAALAAGCTVVLKAAEQAPLTAAAVVRALADAGLPPGAVNLVFGDPARVAEQLIGAPAVRAVTFTGSTAVGRSIAALAAAGLKRCVLELGGHAPVIVAADADVGLAVRATLPAKLGSAGQSCVAPSRYLVHASRYEEFCERFAAAARDAPVGPVANARRLAAMERLTADAVERGARLLCGGERAGDPGFFWAPTVLADVPGEAQVMQEEPFGPIAALAPFDELDDAIDRANATGYAFAAYLFTDSLRTREHVLARLRASNIGINQMAPSMPDAPLGGLDDSGYGYEGGRGGIHAFQHFRLITETSP